MEGVLYYSTNKQLRTVYSDLQKELIALKPSWRGGKIKTAKEFYDRQREFEGEVRYCRDHHSNGM